MNKKNSKAMTLIEILIATLVFTFALGGLLYSLSGALQLIAVAGQRSIATSDLRDMMEAIRLTPFANVLTAFPDGAADGPVGNRYWDIVNDTGASPNVYALDNEQITVNYPSPAVDPLEIRVDLSWQNKRGFSYSMFVHTFKTR